MRTRVEGRRWKENPLAAEGFPGRRLHMINKTYSTKNILKTENLNDVILYKKNC